MNTLIPRRRFLQQTALASAALASAPHLPAADSPNEKLVVAVMGLGRGYDHIKALQQIANVEIAWVCDVDQNRLDRAAKAVGDAQKSAPKAVKDVRRALEDKAVDALFIATPNFWHAPATILACAAGKHVYVEKPGSHNAREGELMVAAARKHNRVVQMGTQRRSWPGVIEGIQKLRDGAIGRVLSARCWYNASRPTIGRGKVVPVPAYLDYELWQGPIPERPYLDNLVHYNWHWRWHWGGGELANNGVHALDIARWGLGVEAPRRITYNGGRYHFDDDQETPDTGVAVFDFGGCGIFWDHSSCNPRRQEMQPFVAWYGDQGSLVQDGNGYKVFDAKGKEAAKGTGPGGDVVHIQNFLDAIRGAKKLKQDIAEGQKSTLLCHLGNIAYRAGRTIHFDPVTHKIVGDAEAEKFWSREYRPGWEPKV
ncbi:MAG: Gfo/Idh/MocA family oxidoreductase [Verrucomicrobia bacterium]|nr:Gfo/Idh/MocA family oxidoreductase [Verrucomicrobiota bacterium]